MRYAFNVIAQVDRQNDVYRPMKIQKIISADCSSKCNRSIINLVKLPKLLD